MCRLSWTLGASTTWNPQRLPGPLMGLLYLFTYIYALVSTQCAFINERTPSHVSHVTSTCLLRHHSMIYGTLYHLVNFRVEPYSKSGLKLVIVIHVFHGFPKRLRIIHLKLRQTIHRNLTIWHAIQQNPSDCYIFSQDSSNFVSGTHGQVCKSNYTGLYSLPQFNSNDTIVNRTGGLPACSAVSLTDMKSFIRKRDQSPVRSLVWQNCTCQPNSTATWTQTAFALCFIQAINCGRSLIKREGCADHVDRWVKYAYVFVFRKIQMHVQRWQFLG